MDNNIMSAQANSSPKFINSAIITVAFLKQYHASNECIKFFTSNFPVSLFPNGLDLSKIKVTGDYKGYFEYINELLECKFEYDFNGNMIKKILSNGNTNEYDSNGNIIKVIHPNGNIYEWKYEYNSKGNKIKEIFSDEIIYEWKYEYDLKGNKIKEIFPNGNVYEWKYEYDLNGNMVKKSISRWTY